MADDLDPSSGERPSAGGQLQTTRVVSRAHRLIRGLLTFYGLATLILVLYAGLAYVPQTYLPVALAREQAQANEALGGGFVALAGGTLLLTLGSLLSAALLTRARYAGVDPDAPWWRIADHGAGFAARTGQGIVVPLAAAATIAVAWHYWPNPAQPVPVGLDADLIGGFGVVVAFIALVTERTMYDFPEPQMAEAPSLRRGLLLATLLLFVAGVDEILRGAGLSWVRWVAYVATVIPPLVATELGLRALARLFLPAPKPDAARAVTDSILTAVITGGPHAPGDLLKSHLGLDFARSWALGFLASAALPAVVATGLLCWGLSGLKLIKNDARGVYERFGAPVAVYGPGLHLLVPWPMGRLRPVEYGTVHEIAVGVDLSSNPPDPIGAEGVPPHSMDRLWETAHADEAHYLVANFSRGLQEFQEVSTEIHVLYRTGLTDQDALASVYSLSDPEMLVHEAAGRLVLNYFDSHTLDQVLVSDQARLQNNLRTDLQRDIDAYHAGIEIVGVVVSEIHPPAGAASAYRRVQAAEIEARTQVSDEQGRAERMKSVAEQEARARIDDAIATAAETLSAARQVAYRFDADRKAYALGPESFLLERRDSDLVAALAGAPLTLIDHRLTGTTGGMIDLRNLAGSQNNGAALAAATSSATNSVASIDEDPANLQPSAEAAAQVESTIAEPDKVPTVSQYDDE